MLYSINAYGVPSLRKRRLILKLSYLYNILNSRYSLPEPFSIELGPPATSQDHTDII